jgi:hypothetical protein
MWENGELMWWTMMGPCDMTAVLRILAGLDEDGWEFPRFYRRTPAEAL